MAELSPSKLKIYLIDQKFSKKKNIFFSNFKVCLLNTTFAKFSKLGSVCLQESFFFFGKWISGKVNSWKVNSEKVFSNVWQCYEKWTGKHFPVFVYVMENELENNLLMN